MNTNIKKKIYLDNNATTPLAPEVFQAVVTALHVFGNPSSIHSFGRESKTLLINARDSIAKFFSVTPQELVFTSSGTEAINMVLRGFFGNQLRGHIITSAVEHAAVYQTCKALEAGGCKVSYLLPGSHGALQLEQIQQAVTQETRFIVLAAANSETGVKTDIHAIARFAKERGIAFVVDGVAILGKEQFSIPDGVSAICFSGHKIHAPKGIGVAIIRKSMKLHPYLTGGTQETGRRAGTEDIAAVVGFAKAIELLQHTLPEAVTRMSHLRDHFEKKLMAALDGVLINGEGDRISNTSNLAFSNIDGDALLIQLDLAGIAASHGSACATGALEPSRVLLNMGLPRQRAAASVRFSLSRYTTEAEIEEAILRIIICVQQLRM